MSISNSWWLKLEYLKCNLWEQVVESSTFSLVQQQQEGSSLSSPLVVGHLIITVCFIIYYFSVYCLLFALICNWLRDATLRILYVSVGPKWTGMSYLILCNFTDTPPTVVGTQKRCESLQSSEPFKFHLMRNSNGDITKTIFPTPGVQFWYLNVPKIQSAQNVMDAN